MRITIPRHFSYWILLLLLQGLFACSESNNSDSDGTGTDDTENGTDSDIGNDTDTGPDITESGGEFLKSAQPRNMTPTPTEDTLTQLAAANSAFAADMYTALSQADDENLFFSPFSLSVGLAMSYGGAAGTTQTQMADTLHFSSFAEEDLHNAFNRMLLDLAGRSQAASGDDGGFELSIANSFFGQKDFPFLSTYLDLLSVNYGAGIYTMDFQADLAAAVAAINDWIAERTADKITDALDPNELTPPIFSVLVNAIYFKAAWNLPFDANDTIDQEFTLLSGETVTTPMMAQGEHFSYGQGDGYQAVSLPYDGEDVEMMIILPDAETFSTFEAGLSAAKIDDIVQNMASAYSTWVTLNVPRFHIASKWELKDIFTAMGMEAPFSDEADFSGMSEEFLRIQKIIHQTDITVDEAGTEAAAATVIVDSNGDADYATVTLNRPFLFLIRDVPTSSILFMGRVTNPSL
ncbi:MAG: serpin family protein [Deltaproteobacteria bacterium]|nr:serpin family protein [Deltaproteobacteria bacterium]MBN2673949.1 serpin family protein [Deltaproteobacteria bacterium]